MRGGEDGDCVTVVDPPTGKHALRVGDGKIAGSALEFKGVQRMEFEMTVTGAGTAGLKFIGTAPEENPWKLERAR